VSPETTVGEAVIDAIKAENYSAIRGLLVEHARLGGGMTMVLRLLERIDNHTLCTIIREMESSEDDDCHRLASASMMWKAAYMKMLEDG
jgi:hypothetical protein